MAASLLGLGLALAPATAMAQTSSNNSAANDGVIILHFNKEATADSLPPPAPAKTEAKPSSSRLHWPWKKSETRDADAPRAKPAATAETSRKAPVQTAAPMRQPIVPSLPVTVPSPARWEPEDAALRAVMFQAQPPSQRAPGEETAEYHLQLNPPGPQRLFRIESEGSLQERIRQEGRERPVPERIQFPEEEPVTKNLTFAPRKFAPNQMIVEPAYVCYGRLYFEDKNSERYGWNLGFIQPFWSSAIFFFDTATLPYQMWTNPCRWYECSAGYCLPGDPVPYAIYPKGLSTTGMAAEIATTLALLAFFP
jgi:hypothetical protein